MSRVRPPRLGQPNARERYMVWPATFARAYSARHCVRHHGTITTRTQNIILHRRVERRREEVFCGDRRSVGAGPGKAHAGFRPALSRPRTFDESGASEYGG